MESPKKSVLFLTRNGLLEPLGQSQILAYLVPLSDTYDFHLISFEKEKDLANLVERSRVQALCEKNNLVWHPLSYRKLYRTLSVLMGFAELGYSTWKVCRKHSIELIHARSYYPTFIALLMHYVLKIPFIFDMRALWPEELVSASRLKKGSLSYRVIKWLEKKCLSNAVAVVSLTQAAVLHLNNVHPDLKLSKKTSVIPTCTDLDRFSIIGRTPPQETDRIVISCVGTLFSGWFKMGMLEAVFNHYMNHYPQVDFEILTRDDDKKIRHLLDPNQRFANRLEVGSAAFQEVPQRLKQHHGSIFFFNADISKLGSCPTRMGELLAAGIPLLANPGVGDVGPIIIEEGVGILLEDTDEESVAQACKRFIRLLQENDIAKRCRNTATTIFSLESGVKAYREIYYQVFTPESPSIA